MARVGMWNIMELPSSQLESFVLCFEIGSVVNVCEEHVAIALVVRWLHCLRTYRVRFPHGAKQFSARARIYCCQELDEANLPKCSLNLRHENSQIMIMQKTDTKGKFA